MSQTRRHNDMWAADKTLCRSVVLCLSDKRAWKSSLWLCALCRSGQFLRRHRGHDWLQTKPMDEMELDHNHSCPLHGERFAGIFIIFFLHLDLLQPVTATRRIDTAKVPALQRVLKVPHVCFSRAVLSSLWWNTSPWPITRCTSTQTGPSVWDGAWHCPPWSASPWWWSSRSCSLRDHWSRWGTRPSPQNHQVFFLAWPKGQSTRKWKILPTGNDSTHMCSTQWWNSLWMCLIINDDKEHNSWQRWTNQRGVHPDAVFHWFFND